MTSPTWSHAQHAHRLVLPRGAGSQPVIDACAALGWPLADVDDGDPQWARPAIMFFEDMDQGTVIEWVDDQVFEVPYVAVHGPGAESAVRALAGRIGARSIAELLDADKAAEQEDAPSARMKALAELAVGAPLEVEPRILERITSRLQDSNPNVRATTALAIRYRPWKQYRPAIEQARAAEQDPVNQEDLDRLLADWDAIEIPRDASS